MGLSGLLLGVILGTVYFMPALVAWRRRVPRAQLILAANLVLGWTVLGWIVLLLVAMRPLPGNEGGRPGR